VGFFGDLVIARTLEVLKKSAIFGLREPAEEPDPFRVRVGHNQFARALTNGRPRKVAEMPGIRINRCHEEVNRLRYSAAHILVVPEVHQELDRSRARCNARRWRRLDGKRVVRGYFTQVTPCSGTTKAGDGCNFIASRCGTYVIQNAMQQPLIVEVRPDRPPEPTHIRRKVPVRIARPKAPHDVDDEFGLLFQRIENELNLSGSASRNQGAHDSAMVDPIPMRAEQVESGTAETAETHEEEVFGIVSAPIVTEFHPRCNTTAQRPSESGHGRGMSQHAQTAREFR
jgi:hypothetical protein